MRGIQSLDHLNGCNKRIHRNRRHPTLNTPSLLARRQGYNMSRREYLLQPEVKIVIRILILQRGRG